MTNDKKQYAREHYEEKMIGNRYGRLVVIEQAESGNYKCRGKVYLLRKWKSKCDCGGVAISFENALKAGRAKSCGCLNKERFSEYGKSKLKHGMSGSKEDNAWRRMISRCKNKNNSQYVNYGGRGISVCDRWANSFVDFLSDVGLAPSKNHSLDRINVNGNYEPENVRWATWKEQERNRTNNVVIELNGEKKCLAEWCEIYGVAYQKAWARICKLNWSADRAFGTP